MVEIRQIIFYQKQFLEFYVDANIDLRNKINYVLSIIKTVEIVPIKFLKHIEGKKGLYEIRVNHGGAAYRIFCLFDENNSVDLLNVINKKSTKTKSKDIELAHQLFLKNHEEKINKRQKNIGC